MSKVTVSKKGWIVIPHEIRERYNIRPGDKVQVVDFGGSIAIVPGVEKPIEKLFGMFKGGPSLTKALLEERRREREREERGLERGGSERKPA